SQMAKLETVIGKRREIAKALSSEFAKLEEVEPPMEPEGFRHVYQMYTIRVKTGKGRRDGLREFLTKKGIISKVYFDPIHLSAFYREKGHTAGELLNTEKLSNEVLSLPIYPTMSPDDVGYLVESVGQFFRG